MEKISINITGSPKPIAEFLKYFNIKNIPETVVQVKTNKPIESPKVLNKSLHHYSHGYSKNPSYKKISLKRENLKLANKFIKENKDIKFFELSNYIKENNKNKKPPSHFALKNFLIKKNYKKYKVYFDNKTTIIIWQKG